MGMFSCCKIVNGNPESHGFMTSSLFVFGPKSRRFAAINTVFQDYEPKELALVACHNKGPKTFKELFDQLNKQMKDSRDGTILVCREKMSSVAKVAHFGQEHLPDDFPRETLHGMEEAIATIVKDCFSQKG